MEIDKVVKGLEQFRADLKPFCGNHADWKRFDDALAMLKEQATANLYKCPNCGTWVSAENVVRCKDCKHYKRDTCSAGAGMAVPPPYDWFCADGERREGGGVKLEWMKRKS